MTLERFVGLDQFSSRDIVATLQPALLGWQLCAQVSEHSSDSSSSRLVLREQNELFWLRANFLHECGHRPGIGGSEAEGGGVWVAKQNQTRTTRDQGANKTASAGGEFLGVVDQHKLYCGYFLGEPFA